MKTCICSAADPLHAAHHPTAFSSRIVVWSCSPECEERIEALRYANGVLSAALVALNADAA